MRRRNKQKTERPLSKVELKDLGASILGHYKHPESWQDGSDTGKVHLRNTKVLKVEEIRLAGMGFVSIDEARLALRAIRAWAAWMGLTTAQLQFDQRANKAPYVYVPLKEWPHVLKLLQSL